MPVLPRAAAAAILVPYDFTALSAAAAAEQVVRRQFRALFLLRSRSWTGVLLLV
jgi:hypothetical protein